MVNLGLINCNLMVNLTKSIQRKFKSHWLDNLYSGKRCKDGDEYRKTLDAGKNACVCRFYPLLRGGGGVEAGDCTGQSISISQCSSQWTEEIFAF